jgi:hypothetical protein
MNDFVKTGLQNLHANEGARTNKAASGLISYILRNPVGFMSQPESAKDIFRDSDFAEAHNYFSAQQSDRYVHTVSTVLFHDRYPKLDLRLYASGMSEFRQSRFWPFWLAHELTSSEAQQSDVVADYLLNVWNEAGNKEQWATGMFYQTGFLEIEEQLQIGEVFYFKCLLPVRRSGARKPDTLTFAFDSETRGFYTINARVRHEEAEHRFRFVEFIEPKLNPPDLRKFLAAGTPKQWRVLLVLDRHIGENLSLFSTHISYLSKIPQFDLTLDASMCPFFHKATHHEIERFLPGTKVKMLESLPADRADYDLVFDPYDWLTEMFDLKPQNDSGVPSIVSGLEYGRCYLHKRRRDILDMHMSSLKRMGIVPANEPIPEFVRYKIGLAERASIRQKARAKLLHNFPGKNSAKIVSFFPFGLSDDRRYPFQRLQTVIRALLNNPNVSVVIAGTDYDTPEMAMTIRSDWRDLDQRYKDRIRLFSNEPLPDLIGLILASDAVVSMDSGPLHLARSLRVEPIGLYTGKVNDDKKLIAFPWLVEDATAEVLKPAAREKHVFPDQLVSAIRKKLNY